MGIPEHIIKESTFGEVDLKEHTGLDIKAFGDTEVIKLFKKYIYGKTLAVNINIPKVGWDSTEVDWFSLKTKYQEAIELLINIDIFIKQ